MHARRLLDCGHPHATRAGHDGTGNSVGDSPPASQTPAAGTASERKIFLKKNAKMAPQKYSYTQCTASARALPHSPWQPCTPPVLPVHWVQGYSHSLLHNYSVLLYSKY